jgi:hypothetical protein
LLIELVEFFIDLGVSFDALNPTGTKPMQIVRSKIASIRWQLAVFKFSKLNTQIISFRGHENCVEYNTVSNLFNQKKWIAEFIQMMGIRKVSPFIFILYIQAEWLTTL